ncbi:hypothetical protein [Croceicoccus mobilis]
MGLTGHNADFIAVRNLSKANDFDLSTRLILRVSGGMAKAVEAALHHLGFDNGIIVARNAGTGSVLARQYDRCADLPDLGTALLINVTLLRMEGGNQNAVAFPVDHAAKARIAIDVIAQLAGSPFIRLAREARKLAISGANVIVLQAIEQFVLYTGVRPDADMVEEAAASAHGAAAAAEIRATPG